MARVGRSARGEIVDFEILAIKQALAAKPVSVGVDTRRKFIDAKDGVKSPVQYAIKDIRKVDISTVPNALHMAFSAAQNSAIIDESGIVDSIQESITITDVKI